jgi:hypothetical protein
MSASGADLRRFVGGPYANLAPQAPADPAGAGPVGGPYANLATGARPVLVSGATAATAAPAATPSAEVASGTVTVVGDGDVLMALPA